MAPLASLAIGPLSVALGDTVLGPVAVSGPWTTCTLTLDILHVGGMTVTIEESGDGGQSWQPILTNPGVGPNTPTLILTCTWTQARQALQLRARLTSSTLFLSTGGSLVLT